MPSDDVQFADSETLLSYSQIAAFVDAVTQLGITSIRITGGEPLMRKNLHLLIEQLAKIEQLHDLSLTTNGMLLDREIERLVDAGLNRINISLDTLREETFKRLTRRDGVERVLAGIEAACRYDQVVTKLNALVLREVNLAEAAELVRFAKDRKLEMRFIEFMPLDGERSWQTSRVVSGNELRELISNEIGELNLVEAGDPSRPARTYEFIDGSGTVGFIDSVTKPFCGTCDRLRLTADGKLRNCLFGQEEWSVVRQLEQLERANCETEQREARNQLFDVVRQSIAAKHASHGIDDPDFVPPDRAMYQIGG